MGLTISATGGAGANVFNVKTKNGIEAVTYTRDQMLDEVEDGEKPVTIAGYSDPFELTSDKWGTSIMIRLMFEIGDGHDQAGGQFSTMFGFKAGPKAKLREVIEAALGRDLKAGEELDLDGLIGARLVLNTHGEVNSLGNTITKYVSCRPAKPKAAKAKASPAWDDEA